MVEDTRLLRIVHDIRSAAEAVGALVLTRLPGGLKLGSAAALDSPEFVALIKHIRPKVVYFAEVNFEPLKHIAEYIDDGDYGTADHPEVKALAKRWMKHDGELCQVVSVVMYEGVKNALFEEATWIADVEASADEIHVEPRTPFVDHEHAKMLADRQTILTERAQKLSEHPLFKGAKLTNTKKEYLAAQLFPDLTRREHSLIVEEANNVHWYRGVSGH